MSEQEILEYYNGLCKAWSKGDFYTRSEIQEKMKVSKDTVKNYQGDLGIIGADGSRIRLKCVKNPILGSYGKWVIAFLLELNFTIDQRKELQKKLEEK